MAQQQGLWRLETKKRWRTAQWGNRYYVVAGSAEAANVIGQNILHIERNHCWEQVEFVGVRVSTAVADGRTGRTYPNTGVKFGILQLATPQQIEVCLKINFFPGVKQPGCKYYHFFADGPWGVAGELNAGAIATANDFAADLLALGAITDALEGLYTSIVAEPRLHIHQMYRAWAAREGVEGGDLG